MTADSNPPPPKLHSLEGVRGAMAFWVFAIHATSLAGIPVNKLGPLFYLTNGEHAVNVFTILSGFVIALLLHRESDKPVGDYYRSFLTRRAFRLFPAYWFALALSILCLPLATAALQSIPWSADKNTERLLILNESTKHFWSHLALHLPMLHGAVPDQVLPKASFTFMGQAWSLSLEWQFYIIAPILVGWLTLKRNLSIYMGGVYILLALFLHTRIPQNGFLLNKIHLFALGILSFSIYQQWRSGLLAARNSVTALVLLSTILALIDLREMLIATVLWTLVLGAEMGAGGAAKLAHRIFTLPPLLSLGRMSYSFYCLHMVALYSVAYILLVVLKVQQHGLYIAVLYVGALALALGLSALSYRYIENPFIAMGRKWTGS